MQAVDVLLGAGLPVPGSFVSSALNAAPYNPEVVPQLLSLLGNRDIDLDDLQRRCTTYWLKPTHSNSDEFTLSDSKERAIRALMEVKARTQP
jgi:hypothetical protein